METKLISILIKRVLIKRVYFYIYWPISAYALFLKYLWDFADDNIWLAMQNLKNQKPKIIQNVIVKNTFLTS